jgi:hypothetical protein
MVSELFTDIQVYLICSSLLFVWLLTSQSVYIETSVRNKCRCSFYCALLTLHVSAPIGGHLPFLTFIHFSPLPVNLFLLFCSAFFRIFYSFCSYASMIIGSSPAEDHFWDLSSEAGHFFKKAGRKRNRQMSRELSSESQGIVT